MGLIAAFAVALGVFYFVASVVRNLIAPAISVFIGESPFELNAFVIETSEFRYGLVIEAGLTIGMTLAILWVGLRYWQRANGVIGGTGSRECPECTWEIPTRARRCPYCTAHLGPDDGVIAAGEK